MRTRTSFLFLGAFLTAISLAMFVGCQKNKDTARQNDDDGHSPAGDDDHDDHDSGSHEHAPGTHGGTIVPVGQESYHVEAVAQADGKLRLYMLGQDETRIQEIDVQDLTAHAKPAGGAAVQFTLKAEPQEGDAAGKTSSFVGPIPAELQGKSLDITIPNLRIGGERFRVSFPIGDESHDDHGDSTSQAPRKVTDQAEVALYLTPGGLYTAEDIAANGNQTASQKFAGFDSKHDLAPQAGDRICPVTLTKANQLCTWIVGGREYHFCCPPCVDEFVATAKVDPSAIKAPEEYVKP